MRTIDHIAELKSQLRDTSKEEPMKEKHFARTGCLLTDLLYGGGEGLGIPYGCLFNFVGDNSSGKSMSGNELIAAEYHNRKKGTFKHQYEDGEKGNLFDTTKMYGLDIMGENLLANIERKKYPVRPQTVQELDARVSIFIKNIKPGEFGIYFLDSLDAVSSDQMVERSKKREDDYEKKKTTNDDGTFGAESAKFLSQEFFRLQGGAVAEKNIIIGMVSQVRMIMGASKYQKKIEDVGGKAKGHWMSMKAFFTPKHKLYMPDSDRAYGRIFNVKMEKTRDGKIERQCNFVYDTEHGIDDVKTSLDFLFNLRNQKTGALKSAAKEIDWCSVLRPTFRKKYEKELKESYDYEELHMTIRRNKDWKKALDTAVIKKWNDLEKKASSGLGGKYS